MSRAGLSAPSRADLLEKSGFLGQRFACERSSNHEQLDCLLAENATSPSMGVCSQNGIPNQPRKSPPNRTNGDGRDGIQAYTRAHCSVDDEILSYSRCTNDGRIS